MPENLFEKLLGTSPDVLNPDYYQLLELDREDLSDDQIESQYKAKMKRLQDVRSTKYKHFVEFLKGQLQNARRTLSDHAARERYDREILEEAVGELKRMVLAFIQISGNLTELEITEILARGRQLNVSERLVNRMIDKQLETFGCQRVRPSVQQIERARRILKVQEEKGRVTDSTVMSRQSLLADLEQEARLAESKAQASGGATKPIGNPAGHPAASDELNLFAPRAEARHRISGVRSGELSSAIRDVPGAVPRPRIVWTGKGEEAKFVRVMPDGRTERPLVFLSMPESNVGVLVGQVTIYVCESLGLQVYRTRHDRWDYVLKNLQACDVLIADFSGSDLFPGVSDPLVITHATIAKYTHDKPVLALTQEPPERRLPGWQFVFYDAERITDTDGESFPDRLKRALRRNLR